MAGRILIALIAFCAIAQSATIAGRVTTLGGKGIAGARVTLLQGDGGARLETATTNSAGGFEFLDTNAEKYVVFAELDGYLPSARRTVDSSATAPLTLFLVPRPSQSAPPALSAAGIRGSIDAAGYSAPASASRTAVMLDGLSRNNLSLPCLDDPLRSMEALSAAVRKDPKALEPRMALGVAQSLAGQEAEAVETLLAATRLAPDDPLPHALLAQAATSAGPRTEEARARLKSFAAAHPALPEARYSYARVLGAEGEPELRAAVSLQPDYVQAHHDLGALLEQRGDLAGAARSYEAALRIAPDSSDTLYRLAQLHIRRGETEKGREVLAKFNESRERQRASQAPRPQHPCVR